VEGLCSEVGRFMLLMPPFTLTTASTSRVSVYLLCACSTSRVYVYVSCASSSSRVCVYVSCAACSFRQLQMSTESQLLELHNDVKLKAFEADRTRLVHEETCHVLKQAQIDNDKLSSKLDVCRSPSSCFDCVPCCYDSLF